MKEIITLTISAMRALQRISTRYPDKLVRLSAEGGGCAGVRQKIDTINATERRTADREIDGTTNLVMDTKSELWFAGTTLDYTEGILGKQFKFQHDTEKLQYACGCGESILPLNHKELRKQDSSITPKMDPCLVKHKKYKK